MLVFKTPHHHQIKMTTAIKQELWEWLQQFRASMVLVATCTVFTMALH
jgi:hypothetical protein